MNENEFDSKVKGLFDQDSIPPIVKKRMNEAYDRIEENGKKNRRKMIYPFFSKKVKAGLIGGLMIAIPAFGVFAYNGFQLFDSEGEVVMEISKSHSDVQEWNDDSVEELKEKVKQGEALVYYKVSDYPEKVFTVYRKPAVFSDFQKYRDTIAHSYEPSKTLPLGFKFVSGKITVDAREGQFHRVESELFAKAAHSEKEVVAKIVKVQEKSDQIVTVTTYSNDKTELFIRSSSNVKLYENMPLDDGELSVTKVELQDHEAFYLTKTEGEFPYQSILWIKEYDREKVMYEVMTYALDNLSKDDLIDIAETIHR
jgi:hypothetical protein